MSAIKWTKELLAECRNERGVVFGMMSKDARDALFEIGINSSPLYVQSYIGTMFGWGSFDGNRFTHANAYRISPSYTPPKLQEKPWVDVPVEYQDEVSAYVYASKSDGCKYSIVHAAGEKNFAGYVYANSDGSHCVCSISRLPGGKEGPLSAPVAVRFWKGA